MLKVLTALCIVGNFAQYHVRNFAQYHSMADACSYVHIDEQMPWKPSQRTCPRCGAAMMLLNAPTTFTAAPVFMMRDDLILEMVKQDLAHQKELISEQEK